MQATWFESFGPASDVKKRAGSFPHLLNEGIVIPHSDGAGVIAAMGKGVSVIVNHREEDWAAQIAAANGGERLEHRIAHTLPLDQIDQAHDLIEQGGFRGCVVVKTTSTTGA